MFSNPTLSLRSLCISLLLLTAFVPAPSKSRVLKAEILIVDPDKSENQALTDAQIVVTKHGKPYKKLISKGPVPAVLLMPVDNDEYWLTVTLAGYKPCTYIFPTRDFDFSAVENKDEDYNAKLVIMLDKVSSDSRRSDDPEIKYLGYNPRTHALDVVKDPNKIAEEKPKPLVDYAARYTMIRKNKTKPEGVPNGKVFLQDTTGATLQQTQTNNTGDFVFHRLNPDKKYKVVLEKPKDVPEDAKVSLVHKDGALIQKLDFDKASGSFVYKLLPAELTKLSVLNEEEDASMKVLHFSKSEEKEINIVQYIYYDVDKWDISPDAVPKFDEVADIMMKNPTLRLQVGSHTDSNGDDDYNMKLSQKRAQAAVTYLVFKGISKDRVSGKGYGETQLLNRCKNGVDCSEEEHRMNRRTEFRFIKSN
jgi:outer membrane protein OmpA-like peptidoglycan-associated protein